MTLPFDECSDVSPVSSGCPIKRILNCKVASNGTRYYQVKWNKTWESAESLMKFSHIVEQFWNFMDNTGALKPGRDIEKSIETTPLENESQIDTGGDMEYNINNFHDSHLPVVFDSDNSSIYIVYPETPPPTMVNQPNRPLSDWPLTREQVATFSAEDTSTSQPYEKKDHRSSTKRSHGTPKQNKNKMDLNKGVDEGIPNDALVAKKRKAPSNVLNNSRVDVSVADGDKETNERCTEIKGDACWRDHVDEVEISNRRGNVVGMKYQCKVCDVLLSTRHTFSRHFKIHTRDKKFRCATCPEEFDSVEECNTHEKSHLPPKCNENEITADSCWQDHMEEIDVKDDYGDVVVKYRCNVCEGVLASRNVFSRHFKIHTRNKKHVCTICSEEFDTVEKCTSHEKSHSLPTCNTEDVNTDSCWQDYLEEIDCEDDDGDIVAKYRCKLCDGILSSRNAFSRHFKLHIRDKKYVCTSCLEEFHSEEDCKLHEEAHVKDLNAEMDDQMQVSLSNNNKADMSVSVSDGALDWFETTEDGTYQCKVCNSTMGYTQSCNRHIKIHTKLPLETNDFFDRVECEDGPDRFLCKICKFSLKDNKCRHVKTRHLSFVKI